MRASVIICTRNRAASLARTLDSLAVMSPVGAPWELIVVDNGSSDETPATVAAYADRLPIRRVEQPVPGLSNARNAGIAAATGDYIVWTDDDVLVDTNWLAAYVEAFARFPDAAIFGGVTEPRFEGTPPAWIVQGKSHLTDLLAIRDFGIDAVPVSDKTMPFGLNYAIRRAEQVQHAYDPELGVAPGRRVGGEETAVMGAILRAGGTGWWLPGPRVFHLIPAARQTRAYVREYYEARGHAMAGWKNNDASPTLGGVPRWRIRRLVESGLRYAALAALPGGAWLRPLIEYSIQKGWIEETRRRCAKAAS